MKKWLCFFITACCLLLCAFALAEDQEIPVVLGNENIGSITVPADVIVVTETGGLNGIRCTEGSGNEVTVSLSGYRFFHGGGKTALSEAAANEKVVVIELEEKDVTLNDEQITVTTPRLRMGYVKSVNGSSLVLNSFHMEGAGTNDQPVSEEVWNEYRSFISGTNISYSSASSPANASGSKEFNLPFVGKHIEGSIKGKLTLQFDLSSEGVKLWEHVTMHTMVLLEVESLELKATSTQAEVRIPLPAIVLTMGVQLPVAIVCSAEYEGEAEYRFSRGFDYRCEFDVGLCDPDFTDHYEALGGEVECVGENALSVYLAIESGVMVGIDEILEGGIAFDAGFIFDNVWRTGHFKVGTLEDKNVYHACDKCYYLEVKPAIGPLALKITCLVIFTEELEVIPRYEFDPIYTKHCSLTYADEEGPGYCPWNAYKVTVHVKDEKGNSIPGAQVSYEPYDNLHFGVVAKATTDSEGNCVVYVPLIDEQKQVRTNVTLTAKVQDPLDKENWLSTSVDFVEGGAPKEQDLTINMKTCALTFKDPGSGTVTNMPGTIHFHPEYPILIPDTVPEKPGVLFTGWNTSPDGTGYAVAPGATVTTNEDTVLYAQWTMLSQYYVIQYNANGGTSAPDGQIVQAGTDALLTDEPAVWANHVFLGWAYEKDALVPDFPTGKANILSNSDNRYVIMLYALWGFDPVTPPVRISFDMNGGPDSKAPAAIWAEPGSWVMIPTRSTWWDEIHVLLGWSTDPNAAEPTYYAGRSYSFTEDTRLYALWKQLPVCTLSFADPAGNDTANMPESILFIPDVSPWVTVPDDVPQKSGRHFTGWNTKADGSGKTVRPGSVILLYADTTLYAQWEVVGEFWMVLFNANGGESAPSPQVCINGQDMVLTTDEATWSEHKFLGWSTDPDADVPEYPAGQTNTIPYSLGKDGLVLYAVWGFTPVDEPIRVSYDMNGGPESEKPVAQWIRAGSWLTVSRDTPVWDGQHIFLGWSFSAWATKPDCKPGDTLHFDSDTTLYAVWKITYRVTEGNGSVWTRNKDGSLRFAADGSLDYFSRFEIDGEKVPDAYLTVSSGSTVVVVDKNYLKTLADGTHTFRFVYTDGSAEGTFTIRQDVPLTGDRAAPGLWTAMILLPLAWLAFELRRTCRKKSR